MLLAPNGESCQLCVWTGESADSGIVIGIDGAMHGFLRGRHFLCADAIRPLAEELVRDGAIRRAALGVSITQVQLSSGRPALLIERVMDQSAAATAGLKAGDIICAFAGTPVSDLCNFSAAIAESNGQVELQVLREDRLINVPAELHPQ